MNALDLGLIIAAFVLIAMVFAMAMQFVINRWPAAARATPGLIALAFQSFDVWWQWNEGQAWTSLLAGRVYLLLCLAATVLAAVLLALAPLLRSTGRWLSLLNLALISLSLSAFIVAGNWFAALPFNEFFTPGRPLIVAIVAFYLAARRVHEGPSTLERAREKLRKLERA